MAKHPKYTLPCPLASSGGENKGLEGIVESIFKLWWRIIKKDMEGKEVIC
jgi:hypothetical protein